MRKKVRMPSVIVLFLKTMLFMLFSVRMSKPSPPFPWVSDMMFDSKRISPKLTFESLSMENTPFAYPVISLFFTDTSTTLSAGKAAPKLMRLPYS